MITFRASEFRITAATHRGESFGMPGTAVSKSMAPRCSRSENGLIAKDSRLYDFTEMLMQVGVLRAKTRDAYFRGTRVSTLSALA